MANQTIRYDAIECDRFYVIDGEQPGTGRCLIQEQSKLDRLLIGLLLDQAELLYDLKPSSVEKQQIEEILARGYEPIRQGTESLSILPRAALRVRKGEKKQKVYDEMLRGRFSEQDFEYALAQFKSAEQIEEFLRRNHVAKGLEQIRTQERRSLVILKLAENLKQQSVSEQLPLEKVHTRFWVDLVSKTETRIVDPRYKLPTFKGVLQRHEITITRP